MKIRSEITLKTQITDYFEKKSNIEQHTSISLNFGNFKNLDGLVMEESVYSGGDNKF